MRLPRLQGVPKIDSVESPNAYRVAGDRSRSESDTDVWPFHGHDRRLYRNVDLSQEIFRALTFNDGGKGLDRPVCCVHRIDSGSTAGRMGGRRKRMLGIV